MRRLALLLALALPACPALAQEACDGAVRVSRFETTPMPAALVVSAILEGSGGRMFIAITRRPEGLRPVNDQPAMVPLARGETPVILGLAPLGARPDDAALRAGLAWRCMQAGPRG